jgi:hypothetical protein
MLMQVQTTILSARFLERSQASSHVAVLMNGSLEVSWRAVSWEAHGDRQGP